MAKNIIKHTVILFLIPLTVILGATIFGDKRYAFISLVITVLSCVPFFLCFEKGQRSTRRIVIIAVMTAMSAAGRFVFAPIPFFKPVTAVVIITAIYFGSEAGFITGAMSAVISNFYFGQGPWTPFQMFSWGILGFIAGLLADPLQRSKILLALYGFFAGVAYSWIMDVWTTLWADGSFNLARFIASVASALPVTIIYIVSNIIFLLILNPLLGKKINRIKTKYNI